jgi:type III pantothenate kinase
MLMTVDIGNTHIVVGVFEAEELVFHTRLSTDMKKTEDEYAAILLYLLSLESIVFSTIDGVVISSVVPTLINIFQKFSIKHLKCNPLIIEAGNGYGIEIDVENPKEVGADRVVNAIAAIQLFGSPVIVVDFGTATTFDIVNDQNAYVGGVIAPGIEITASALHIKTAKLPLIEVQKCDNIIGKNTINSMNAGIYFGYLSLVDGIIYRIIETLSKKSNIKIVSTGGLGDMYLKESKYIVKYEPHLTLYGLRLVYDKINNL